MQRILIVGATSAIARATAQLFAQRGDALYLLGRSEARLEAWSRDPALMNAATVTSGILDVDCLENHGQALDEAFSRLGGVDIALVAHGTLPDQRACEASVSATVAAFHTNAVATIALLTELANRMGSQGNGTLAVLSSVAGDRGRQSNYVYGSAKGAVTVFLQGLRNRLHGSGVRVVTIKPGFVDTPMTAAFAKGLLWSRPETVARGIVGAVDRGRDQVYLPGFWRPVMAVIRCIPEWLFKRMAL